MKKLCLALCLALLCALLLTGCTVSGLERDVQVALLVDGELIGSRTVNIFNNAILPEPEANGSRIFRGWTLADSWTEDDAENVPVLENKGLVRYRDIEGAAVNHAQSVVLRAVFTPAPQRDLVIAWYAKEKTSGLNQEYMDAFLTKLKEYLASQGYQPDSMDILLRGYEGGVGDTCAAITKDGDVDITVGWSNSDNLTSTGGWTEGVDFLENVGSITIGATARFSARISDTELSKLVYAWIQAEYGEAAEPQAEAAQAEAASVSVEPAPAETEMPAATEAPAEESSRLVIGWYAKTETSGLDEAIMTRFEAALKEALTAQGYAVDTMEITLRPYDGKVAEVQDAVTADGDVDVMVGMKAFALNGIEMAVIDDVPMGEKTDRKIHRISNTTVANTVIDWLAVADLTALFQAQ